MARDFFRQSAAGASPRGSLISQIQTALDAVPNGPQVRVDGAFGGNTATAVRTFQASNHLQPTGVVTDQVWQKLANSSAAPSMFERCLQLTASYEGTGYTHVVGNFDGAGITWGIIGFTLLAGGELGIVIGKINTDLPALIAQAFGANAAELLHICDPATSVGEKTAFANSVTRDGGVIEPWNTAFQTLGGFPEVQALQTQRAHDIYWAIAVGDGRALSMEEELDLALMFDVAVQNGGLQGNHMLQPIKDAFATEKPATAQARRLIVTRFVTDASNPASANDVNSRKSCISTGAGTVHRSTYLLADWALLDGMLPPPELANAPVDPDILHWRKLRLAAARARTMRSSDTDR